MRDATKPGAVGVVVRQAACRRPVYRSRRYWEEQFAAWGLWPRFLAGSEAAQRCSHLLDDVFPDFQPVARAANALGTGLTIQVVREPRGKIVHADLKAIAIRLETSK
jgi:hypothetical protein